MRHRKPANGPALAKLPVNRPPRPHYAARIFDFDGTLVDTDDINLHAMHAALAAHGVHAPLSWLRTAPLGDLGALRRRSRDELGVAVTASDQEIVAAARSYWVTHRGRARPVGPVVAVARTAAAVGPVAVASANDGQVVRATLTAAGLASLFEVVIAREDVSRLKPAPDAFLKAASRLGLKTSECLAYENTDEGVAAARAADMDVIDVRRRDWRDSFDGRIEIDGDP
ncbi:HAD-IA family hydrolase [Streptomyces daliensis]|uniref:HAD family phosphatase n=1 Tax=Streptomyces daliensis TaxID=299421 RepID=A0A8T4IV60_9ACTN|nr:HAD family phosphatase [Streptomyces daliensis]